MEIDLVKVVVSDNRIEYHLDVSRPLRKYFLKDTSYVQYDRSIDVGTVDGSILAIPVVGMIAPISWAAGADVRMGELDSTYLESLAKIKEIYRRFYSHFSFAGEIEAERPASNKFGGDRTGLLFSGGIDSLTSFVRHRSERPDLISVWGLRDIPPFEAKFWSGMWSDVCSLANREGVGAFQVKTDLIRNVNYELLTREFGVRWFGGGAHGLFLTSLCAPVTATQRMGTVIIASSYTEDYRVSLGFHPLVDNNISWADVGVVHDGFELSRQQKLRFLCREENLHYLSNLRVCSDSARKPNCGDCEKCFRTIAGMALEGVDPNRCNFAVDERTFPHMRDCLRKGKMAPGESQQFMWRDIQKNIPEQIDTDVNGSREFLAWLRTFDLSNYKSSRVRWFLWELGRLLRNKRVKAPAIRRKIKCYYHIILAKRGKRPAARRA